LQGLTIPTNITKRKGELHDEKIPYGVLYHIHRGIFDSAVVCGRSPSSKRR
jgi:hypothetical protein